MNPLEEEFFQELKKEASKSNIYITTTGNPERNATASIIGRSNLIPPTKNIYILSPLRTYIKHQYYSEDKRYTVDFHDIPDDISHVDFLGDFLAGERILPLHSTTTLVSSLNNREEDTGIPRNIDVRILSYDHPQPTLTETEINTINSLSLGKLRYGANGFMLTVDGRSDFIGDMEDGLYLKVKGTEYTSDYVKFDDIRDIDRRLKAHHKKKPTHQIHRSGERIGVWE